MLSRTGRRFVWLAVFAALAMLAVGAGLACSAQSPNIGKYYKGRILHLSIAAMERTDELRWTLSPRNVAPSPDDMYYRLTPESAENELVLLRVKVENHTATSAILNIDHESAQLRDFLQGRYFPIDVSARADENAGIPENPADGCNVPVNPDDHTICVRFLWNAAFEETRPDGQIQIVQRAQELPNGTGLDGWMVFEAPKDTQFRSFRWAAGDTITIDF